MRRACPRWVLLAATLGLLAGCENAMHDMYDQPKYKPLAPSPLHADGNSAQPPPQGTRARVAGAVADASGGRRGAAPAASAAPAVVPVGAGGRSLAPGRAASAGSIPMPVTMALLQRGRQRFDIDCAPCHGRDGYGDGLIVRRGFPAPPSYHTARLRQAPDSHFYRVITRGYGIMYPYADRVTPRDRWAIVAYIRALQLSQHAPAAALDAHDLRALGPRQGAGGTVRR